MCSQLTQNVLAVNDNCGLHLSYMAFELHAIIFLSLWEFSPHSEAQQHSEFTYISVSELQRLWLNQKQKLSSRILDFKIRLNGL